MIRTFCFQAPLGNVDPDAAIATLNAKMEQLARLHRALRGVDLKAAEGVFHMDLTCEGRDRWTISRHAKLIAAAMVRRIKLDVAQTVLTHVVEHENLRSRTKEQGRPVENAHRGPRRKPAVQPWWDPASQP